MSKRAHGEGSVRAQGKGHVASIMVTVDGERHRVNRAGKTPAEAVRRRNEAVDALRRGESVKVSHVLFSELMCPCCHGVLGHEEVWFDPKVGPPERAILTDLIAESRLWLTGDNPIPLGLVLDRAEARLREVTKDE